MMTRSKVWLWERIVQVKEKIIGEKVRESGNKGKVNVPVFMVL